MSIVTPVLLGRQGIQHGIRSFRQQFPGLMII